MHSTVHIISSLNRTSIHQNVEKETTLWPLLINNNMWILWDYKNVWLVWVRFKHACGPVC